MMKFLKFMYDMDNCYFPASRDHHEQMKNVNEVAARAKAQKMLDEYNRKHPKVTA